MSRREQMEGERVTENIRLCPDGAYRWSYEFDMLRNPTILITVWKVLGIAFGAVYLFSLVVSLIDASIRNWSDLWGLSRIFLLLAAVFFVLGLVSYLILAAAFGWKYIVLFEMTDRYVKHIQTPRQLRKAKKLARITTVAGLLAKRPSTVGAGLLAGSKSASISEFSRVRTVRARRWRHTIHVNQLLDRNQVYAENADFDFVERFIKDHCVNAKIR